MKRYMLLAIMLGIAYSVYAIRIRSGKNLVINTPVYEDMYIAGGEVIINAPIYGDLIVTGGTVTINDSIANDILAAGGTISFNGYVGDDIRCAGGKLFILNSVAGDVVAAGGNITIGKEAVIGNLVSAGGEIVIDGRVTGAVTTRSGTLLLNGTVSKELNCMGDAITINGVVQGPSVIAAGDKLIIGKSAVFNNEVRYWADSKNIDFGNSVKNGTAVYDPSLTMERDRWYFLGFATVLGVLWYLGMALLIIMIIQYLFSRTMKNAGQIAYDRSLRSLGYGLLFWIGVPVAAALACITIIGVPIGVILLFNYIILALFAGVITSVVAANWLNSRSATGWSYWRMVFVALGIFIVFKILSLTPFLGWFVFGLLVCIAFGAILLSVNWRKRTS